MRLQWSNRKGSKDVCVSVASWQTTLVQDAVLGTQEPQRAYSCQKETRKQAFMLFREKFSIRNKFTVLREQIEEDSTKCPGDSGADTQTVFIRTFITIWPDNNS